MASNRRDEQDIGFRFRGNASNRNDSYRNRDYRADSYRGRGYRDRDRDYEYHHSDRRDYRSYGEQRYSQNRDYYENQYDDSDPYAEIPKADDNTGEGDVSSSGDAILFLVVRGFKSNTTEELLAKGLEKLYLDATDKVEVKPTAPPGAPAGFTGLGMIPGAAHLAKPAAVPGATPGSLRRVIIIRDRDTDKNMQYGFAEYHSVTDSKAALAKARSLGDKFTISSKKVEVDFMDVSVFPVVMPDQREDPKYTIQFPSLQMHKYHDTRYYASEHIVNEKPPAAPGSENSQKTKTNKKRSNNMAALDVLDSGSDRIKKTKTSATAGFAMAEQWTKKQHELRGEDGGANEEDSPSRHPSPSSANHDLDTEQEYIPQSFIWQGIKDGEATKMCLLCKTKLNEHVTAEAHVYGSKLHAENIKDEQKYEQGLAMVKKSGETVKVKRRHQKEEKTEYRDRAKERRIQEAKEGTAEKIKVSLKKQGGPVEKPSPAPPSYGKGMAMLQKAGWREGEGLGSGGGGISAPLEQFAYAAGVGLGHEGGKKGDAVEEANRATRGNSPSFLEKTKEAARARFERM